jgi:pimeloyl-ACP methyl ester carboxylesterase
MGGMIAQELVLRHPERVDKLVLAANIPGARLVKIPGATHGFNIEQVDAFNREVLDFLGTCG